jgi:putative hydrolase of the HAD superfamily
VGSVKKEPIRAIVFDLFHTLVDPEDFRPREFHRAETVANILGLEKAKFVSFWDSTHKQRLLTPRLEIEYVKDFASATGVILSESALDRVNEALGRYQDLAILNPRDEAVAAIQSLKKRGFKLGLLSNSHQREVSEWPRSPLARFFDSTVFSHETGLMKPERGAYLRVSSRLGVAPPLCAFVGDGGDQELAGAREAGFGRVIFMSRFVSRNGLRSAGQIKDARAQADSVANDFPALCRIMTGVSL